MKPLIYTSKGNVPIDTLDYSQDWENHIESEVTLFVEDGVFKPKVTHGGYMVFVEKYHDKASGALVKENRHVCVMKAPNANLEQGLLG